MTTKRTFTKVVLKGVKGKDAVKYLDSLTLIQASREWWIEHKHIDPVAYIESEQVHEEQNVKTVKRSRKPRSKKSSTKTQNAPRPP